MVSVCEKGIMMLYNSEEAFVDKLIASLKMRNIKEIPFDTPLFYSGVERMRQCFQMTRESFGKDAGEISMLFIKDPYEGVFTRFRDAISEQNGWYISFVNPEYVVGIIRISEKDACAILEEDDIAVTLETMNKLVDAFCEGANIAVG